MSVEAMQSGWVADHLRVARVVNRENYAMTGAILVDPDGKKFFVKMIGPMKVVKANRNAFVKMIKSIDQ